eukprot:jgi/Mesen1/10688/ME000009S10474
MALNGMINQESSACDDMVSGKLLDVLEIPRMATTLVIPPSRKRKTREKEKAAKKAKVASTTRTTKKRKQAVVSPQKEKRQKIAPSANMEVVLELTARSYQHELLEIAEKRNTIAFLETGTGKTLIAVMLIRAKAMAFRSDNRAFLAIFLVPTIPLAHQACVKDRDDCARQLKALESVLDSTVYTIQDREELNSYLPSAKEEVQFYDPPTKDTSKLIQELRKVYSVMEDRALSAAFAEGAVSLSLTQPDMEEIEARAFAPLFFQNDSSANLVNRISRKMRQLFGNLHYCVEELGQYCAYKAAQLLLISARRGEFDSHVDDLRVRQKLIDCRSQLLTASLQLLKCDLAPCSGSTGEAAAYHEEVQLGLITPKLQALICLLLKYRDLAASGNLRCIVFTERKVTAKVISELLQELPCLSFLKCHFLIGTQGKQGPVKEMNHNEQEAAIDSFRSGKVNVLVATNVAEEGLDIAHCHTVIRFDLSKTVRSHIQSRGRARMQGSSYIAFAENGNADHWDLLKSLVMSERTMREEALERNHMNIASSDDITDADVEEYRVEATGATVNTHGSISLVHQYCAKLPADGYCDLKPCFSELYADGGYTYEVRLPSNSHLQQSVQGEARRNKVLAKQIACLHVIRLLHASGGLTDHLLPYTGNDDEKDEGSLDSKTGKKNHAGRRRLEVARHIPDKLCGSICNGTPNDAAKPVTLYSYSISFDSVPAPAGYAHRSGVLGAFTLLTEHQLDPEAASMAVEVSLPFQRATWARMAARGPLSLTSEQMKTARRFHQVLLCKVLRRCYTCHLSPLNFQDSCSSDLSDHGNSFDSSACPEASATSLPSSEEDDHLVGGKGGSQVSDDERLWDLPVSYLLLPLSHDDPTQLDWSAMSTALATWELEVALRGLTSTPLLPPPPPAERESSEVLKLANASIEACDMEDMVVAAVHNGFEYFVRGIRAEMNANSRFPGDEYSTFAAYFHQRQAPLSHAARVPGLLWLELYNYELKQKEQPLLWVGVASKARNCLLRPFPKDAVATSKRAARVLKKAAEADRHTYIELPPELCRVVMPGRIFRSAQLLPSVMHRLENVLLACQLRDTIAAELGSDITIPASKIMEALMTAKCVEEVSLERYEFIGDAFLKYAVSVHLYRSFPRDHEGLLTSKRTRVIENAALCKSALRKGLQAYIQASPFLLAEWDAPGVPARLATSCEHLKIGASSAPDAGEQSEDEGTPAEDGEASVDDSEPDDDADSVDSEEDEEVEKAEDGEAAEEGRRGGSRRAVSTKCLADAVEALIGVFWMEGGDLAAAQLMAWLGMSASISGFAPTSSGMSAGAAGELLAILPSSRGSDSIVGGSTGSISSLEKHGQGLESSAGGSSLHGLEAEGEALVEEIDPAFQKALECLEGCLKYPFERRELLLEAVTHASYVNSGKGFSKCYQRLEFLGDAALDYLITRHLERTHEGLSPGQLTDLRSASVNSEAWARTAVREDLRLQRFLRHGSEALLSNITSFVVSQREAAARGTPLHTYGSANVQAPKALGDLVESIAGAVLVDSGYDVETVWTVMRPLLEPLVTPDTIELQPYRRLLEFCQTHRLTLKYQVTKLEGKSGKETNEDARGGGAASMRFEVLVNGEVVATVDHVQKKQGKKLAAIQALSVIESPNFKPQKQQQQQPAKGSDSNSSAARREAHLEKLLESGRIFLPAPAPASAPAGKDQERSEHKLGPAEVPPRTAAPGTKTSVKESGESAPSPAEVAPAAASATAAHPALEAPSHASAGSLSRTRSAPAARVKAAVIATGLTLAPPTAPQKTADTLAALGQDGLWAGGDAVTGVTLSSSQKPGEASRAVKVDAERGVGPGLTGAIPPPLAAQLAVAPSSASESQEPQKILIAAPSPAAAAHQGPVCLSSLFSTSSPHPHAATRQQGFAMGRGGAGQQREAIQEEEISLIARALQNFAAGAGTGPGTGAGAGRGTHIAPAPPPGLASPAAPWASAPGPAGHPFSSPTLEDSVRENRAAAAATAAAVFSSPISATSFLHKAAIWHSGNGIQEDEASWERMGIKVGRTSAEQDKVSRLAPCGTVSGGLARPSFIPKAAPTPAISASLTNSLQLGKPVEMYAYTAPPEPWPEPVDPPPTSTRNTFKLGSHFACSSSSSSGGEVSPNPDEPPNWAGGSPSQPLFEAESKLALWSTGEVPLDPMGEGRSQHGHECGGDTRSVGDSESPFSRHFTPVYPGANVESPASAYAHVTPPQATNAPISGRFSTYAPPSNNLRAGAAASPGQQHLVPAAALSQEQLSAAVSGILQRLTSQGPHALPAEQDVAGAIAGLLREMSTPPSLPFQRSTLHELGASAANGPKSQQPLLAPQSSQTAGWDGGGAPLPQSGQVAQPAVPLQGAAHVATRPPEQPFAQAVQRGHTPQNELSAMAHAVSELHEMCQARRFVMEAKVTSAGGAELSMVGQPMKTKKAAKGSAAVMLLRKLKDSI